jgi:hypothetical protein
MEQFNELKEFIAKLEEEANEFFVKHNKAAGLRLRKGLQDVKAMAQDLRKASLEVEKSLGVKKRVQK